MFGLFKGIRFISRWIYRTLVIVLILVVAAILLRDPLLQSLTERRILDCTGLDARMKNMDVGLLQQRATLENLKIYNTAEFGGGVMLDVEELHFELDSDALKRGELHFKLIRIELNLLNIVVNQNGDNNFRSLYDYRLIRQASAANDSGPLDDLIDPSLTFTGIDMLNLSVHSFHKTDLTKNGPPEVIDVNTRNAVYRNVRSRDELMEQLTPDIVRTAAGFLYESYYGKR